MAYLTYQPINTFSQGDVNNAQNSYNTDLSGVTNAQNNLEDYRKNMVDPAQMYQTNLKSAEDQFGFNPQDLLTANKNLAQTQTVMSNLPQAIQQQGGGYGVTAGQMANNYQSTAGNLQGVLAGQGNAVNALQSTLQNALTQGGQQTQFGVQGQQMQLSTLQNQFQNASNVRDSALSQLQNLQKLYQNQGQFNASEQAAYEQANAAMVSANAAMATAQAQANLLNQQSQFQGMKNQLGSSLLSGTALTPSQYSFLGMTPPASSSPSHSSSGGSSLLSGLGNGIQDGRNFIASAFSHIPGIGSL